MDRRHKLSHLTILSAISFMLLTNPVRLWAQAEISAPAGIHKVNLRPVQSNSKDIPIRIVVPQINVNLNVEPSLIKENTWEINDKAASYAVQSSFLDEDFGNTILFAHARKYMFKDLNKLKIGDEIIVLGKEGFYIYKVNYISKISPLNVDAVKSLGDSHLTLFTCDGPFDANRLLVKAKRINQTQYSSKGVI